MIGKGERSLSQEASTLSSANPSINLAPPLPPPVPPRDYFLRSTSARSSLDNKSCIPNDPTPASPAVVPRSSALSIHPPPPRKSPPPLPPGALSSASSTCRPDGIISLSSTVCSPTTCPSPLPLPSVSLLAPVAVPSAPTHPPPPLPPSMPLLPPPVPSPRPSPRVSRSGSHEPLAALVANGPHLPETTATTATPAFDRMRSQNSDTVSLTSISSRTSRGNGNTPNVSENRRPSGVSNQRSSSPSGSVTFGLDIAEAYYSPPADADEIPDGNQSPGTADLDDMPRFQQPSAASNRNSNEAPALLPVDNAVQRGRSSTNNSLEVVDASSPELRPPPPHVHRHGLQGPCAEIEASGALTASVEEPWEMVSHSQVDPANMICTETRALSGRNPSASPALSVMTPTRSPPPLNSKQDAANPNHRRAKFKFFNINIFGGHRHRQQNAANIVGATANANSSRPSLPCQPPLHSNSTEASPPHPPARPAHGPSAAAGVGAELPRNSLPTNSLNPNFVRGIHQGCGGGGMEPLQIRTDLAPPRPPPRPNHGPCPHTAAVAEGGARNGPLVEALRAGSGSGAGAGAGSCASRSTSASGASRAPPYPQQTYLPARPPYPPPHSLPLPPWSASGGPASGALQTQVSCPPAVDHAAQQLLHQLRGVRRRLMAALACTRSNSSSITCSIVRNRPQRVHSNCHSSGLSSVKLLTTVRYVAAVLCSPLASGLCALRNVDCGCGFHRVALVLT